MPTTTVHALRYPAATDPADVPTDMQKLASDVDVALLPATVVAAAAVRVLANLLLAGDAQPAWRVMGDGRQEWGVGAASAPDTNLYRPAANLLGTDYEFEARVGTAYRVRVGYLPSRVAGGLQFGSPIDANFYRSAAGLLGSDTDLEARLGSAYRVRVGYIAGPAAGGLQFGTAYDTNLYRAAAGVVKTDGALATTSYGTTLPASPVDGQEFTLVDSITAPNYQWRFRYNAGSTAAHKWEFIGGSDAIALEATAVGGGPLNTPTAYGPTITVPRTGVYQIGVRGTFSGGAGGGSGGVGPWVAGAVVGPLGYVSLTSSGLGTAVFTQASGITVAAGGTVQVGTYITVATNHQDRHLWLHPVRVS